MGATASITDLPEDQQLAAFKELQRTYNEGCEKDEDALGLIKKLHAEYQETMAKKEKAIRGKKPAKRNGMFQKGLRMSELHQSKKGEAQETEKSEPTMDLLRTSVMDTLFEDHDSRTIEAVLRAMRMRSMSVGDIIAKQGSTDVKFTVIETGKVEVKKGDKNQAYLSSGNMFGEMALIYDEESPYEYSCTEDGVVWELDRDTFRQVQHVCAAKTVNERVKWIAGIEILGKLSKPQLAKVARALQAKNIAKGKDIVTQGDMGDTFYIIQEGQVEVLVTDQRQASDDKILTPRAVDEMKAGDYFGEAALITHEPRNATCRAKTDVVVLALHSDDFKEVMGPLSELLEHNAIMRALQNVDILGSLNKVELDRVADILEELKFPMEEQTIISAGDVSPALYIVREGHFLCVDESGEVSADMHDGLSFGDGCVTDQPEKFTISTKGGGKCMKLPVDKLKAVLGIGAPGSTDVANSKLLESASQDSVTAGSGGGRQSTRRASKLMCSGPIAQHVALKNLQSLAVLGEGSFGQVTMVKTVDPESGAELILALKRMCKQHIIESGQQEHIQRERQVLASLPENVFLLNLYATYQDNDCIYMLTNLCQGGELFSLIHTFDGDIPLPVHQAQFYAANVFLALEHLHNHGVIYRDMKPENILLGADGYLCVIDLGFAKFVPYESNDDGDITLHDLTYTMCGTPEYMAPEFVLQTGHNAGADYWSLGILIYEMFFARTPFLPEDEDMGQLFKNIAAVRTQQQRSSSSSRDARPSMLRFDPDFENSNADAVQIVCQLLNGNPNYRLGMLRNGSKDVRNHGWFSDMDWEAMQTKSLPVPFKPKIKNKYDTSCFDDEDVGQLEVIAFEGIDGDVFKAF